MEIIRLFDILPHYLSKYPPKEDVLAGKDEGEWKKYNISEYIEIVNNLSYAFLSLGIKKGDKIATISNNRPEWNFVDMAILQVGAVHVPIYPTISESDYQYILEHSEVKIIFLSSEELLKKIEKVLPREITTKNIYTFKKLSCCNYFFDLVEFGKKHQKENELAKTKAEISTNDLATIIYTSGTTGNPKGVMLSHFNIISNIEMVKYIPPCNYTDKALSYLPLCHIYERTLNYLFQYLGISVYYAENISKISENIKEIKPSIMGTVPRLLEKVYDKIMTTGEKLTGIKKMIFNWSIKLGLQYEMYGANGKIYDLKLSVARKLVFSKWQQAMGGNIKIMATGGAALQERLGRIFWAAGIPLVEGYGLTETSPVLAIGDLNPNGYSFGSVGAPLKGVSIKIAEDGEILAKGPNVMLGYYKEPELTAQAIDQEGWFHTGDIGEFNKFGHLKITGRKKEIFKTSMGKYINPQLLENKFKESPFIDQLLVLGENQKFAAALIVPEFNHLKIICKQKGIEYTTNSETIKNPKIKRLFQEEVDKFNKFFGDTEKIRKFELIDHEWTIESGELTASLKLKRKVIDQKYTLLINRLFDIKED